MSVYVCVWVCMHVRVSMYVYVYTHSTIFLSCKTYKCELRVEICTGRLERAAGHTQYQDAGNCLTRREGRGRVRIAHEYL